MDHNEVACLTAGTAMIQAILEQAEAIAPPSEYAETDPRHELRTRLPRMLAQLSPEARALLYDHQSHVVELVAGLHCALRSN